MCPVRAPLFLNALPHWSHSYGRSFPWFFLCCSKLTALIKAFPHWSQGYGRSPVCLRMWILSWDPVMYFWSHWSQQYRPWPVWTRLCTLSLDILLKVFPHSSHLCRSPRCIFLCLPRYRLDLNIFPHWSQGKGVSVECLTAWRCRRLIRGNSLSQCSQVKIGRSARCIFLWFDSPLTELHTLPQSSHVSVLLFIDAPHWSPPSSFIRKSLSFMLNLQLDFQLL